MHYTGYPVDSADLLYRKGNFWLHVVVTIPTSQITDNGEAVGVDLGLTHPAVTYTRQFLGKKHWKEVDRRYNARGTKSARKHLRKLVRRDESYLRFRRDRQIVTTFYPNGLYVALLLVLPSCLRT
jgi:putative transposase